MMHKAVEISKTRAAGLEVLRELCVTHPEVFSVPPASQSENRKSFLLNQIQAFLGAFPFLRGHVA